MATASCSGSDMTGDTREIPQAVADKMKATFLGQCIGDALGLLTEFLPKEDAIESYGKNPKSLHYNQKVNDPHRNAWVVGDWTDDTDQMIVILHSLLYNKGQTDVCDFATRIKRWMTKGFPELGDFAGKGLGRTTKAVLTNPCFTTDPVKAANEVWEANQRKLAPNGSAMRTSVLGMHQWNDLEKVVENAVAFGKCTHSDPRCQASVIAISTCIAFMLQHTAGQDQAAGKKPKKMPLDDIIKQSYHTACRVLDSEEQRKELWQHMSCKKLSKLKLCELGKIGYTYKCMGSGFWAVRQNDFKKAMIELVMEGGDADTNGAVAGSMLACKLGQDAIPDYWISELAFLDVMMDLYQRFIRLQSEMHLPVEQRTSNEDLSIENLDAIGDEYQRKETEKWRQQQAEKEAKMMRE